MTPELTEEQQNVEIAPSTPSSESTRSSPGMLIRRARERVRMTPEELAAQTKLARGTLDALERDDFKLLVEPVYVRGYYRKCAKVLGIGEKDLVDAYEAMVAPRAPEAPAKLRLASGSELGSGGRLPLALAFGAALIGVIVLALVWFARGEVNHVPPLPVAKADIAPVENKTDASAADAAATNQTAAQDATSTPAAVPTDAAPAAPAVAPAQPAAAAPSVPAPTVAAPAPVAPAVKPPVSAATPAPAAAGSASLTLRFNVTSWARIDDASGKTLINGLVRSGEKQTLTGPAPFAVFLGNAPGVSVDINGKAIDLSKYTAQNNTARFSAAP